MLSRRLAEAGFALLTLLFGALIAWGATEFGTGWSSSGPQPGTFPFYIGCLIALASAGNLARAVLPTAETGSPFLTRAQWQSLAQFVLPIVAFVILALSFGLYVATALYIFFAMAVQGRYPLWHAGAVAIGLPVFLYLLLEKGFQVQLLKGPLEGLLGL